MFDNNKDTKFVQQMRVYRISIYSDTLICYIGRCAIDESNGHWTLSTNKLMSMLVLSLQFIFNTFRLLNRPPTKMRHQIKAFKLSMEMDRETDIRMWMMPIKMKRKQKKTTSATDIFYTFVYIFFCCCFFSYRRHWLTIWVIQAGTCEWWTGNTRVSVLCI